MDDDDAEELVPPVNFAMIEKGLYRGAHAAAPGRARCSVRGMAGADAQAASPQRKTFPS